MFCKSYCGVSRLYLLEQQGFIVTLFYLVHTSPVGSTAYSWQRRVMLLLDIVVHFDNNEMLSP